MLRMQRRERTHGQQPVGRFRHDGQACPIVTISSAYGAGGSVVAPKVATRLGLPFLYGVTRANPAMPVCSECLSGEEAKRAPISRVYPYLAHSAPAGPTVLPPDPFEYDEELRTSLMSAIAALGAGGGVILGCEAPAALAGTRRAFHVRLEGPAQERARQGADLERIPQEEADRHMAETDETRNTCVERLYRRRPADIRLYHLVVDTTKVPLDVTADIVATAATAALRLGDAERDSP